MKVGDLVKAMKTEIGTKIRIGLITDRTTYSHVPDKYTVFDVMTSDGKVNTYTSNQLRVIK